MIAVIVTHALAVAVGVIAGMLIGRNNPKLVAEVLIAARAGQKLAQTA